MFWGRDIGAPNARLGSDSIMKSFLLINASVDIMIMDLRSITHAWKEHPIKMLKNPVIDQKFDNTGYA